LRPRTYAVAFALTLAAILSPARSALAAKVVLVYGVIHTQIIQGDPLRTPHGAELESQSTWEGTLIGTAVSHVFGSEPFSEGSHAAATAKTTLFGANGNLFFNETSVRDGSNVVSTSVVRGGTGVFRGAEGRLNLTGTFIGGGRIEWVYSGSLELKD
jgi:hypothetical protein